MRAVEDYPDNLRMTLESVAPKGLDRDPTIVVLTPGIYNSAYFEHSFLADQMGVELVEGQDLVVVDGALHDEDDAGPEPGRRRLPPHRRRLPRSRSCSSANSVLGVPGIFDVYRGGRRHHRQRAGRRHRRRQVDLHLHARDHRVLHSAAAPILKNVPTYVCRKPDDLNYVLEHLAELVVKEVHGSGGYGMLVGPAAIRDEIDMLPHAS